MRNKVKSKHIQDLLVILRQAPATKSFEEAFDEASLKLAQGPGLLLGEVPVEFIDPSSLTPEFDYAQGCAQVEATLRSYLPRQKALEEMSVPEYEVLGGIQSKVSHITVHLTEPLTDKEKKTLAFRLKELATGKVRDYVTGDYNVEFEDA